MEALPFVSCVIPTYKRNDSLDRAINCVLSQSYNNIEVIVVDDNNPGDEWYLKNEKLMQSYHDNPRVRYIVQDRHINGAVARNKGIEVAKGELIAFLDDDDEWTNDKIEKQVNYLIDNPDADAITCLYSICKEGKVISTCKPYDNKDLQYKVLYREVGLATPTFLGKKSVISKFGGFNPQLQRHQDFQFYVDFLNNGTILPLNEVLVIVNADSTINRPNTQKIIDTKKQFFNIIRPTLGRYNKTQLKRIYNAHYFEIILVALKEHKYSIAIKYLIKVGFSPVAYRDLYQRYISRK